MGTVLLSWVVAAATAVAQNPGASNSNAAAPPDNPDTIVVTGERAKRSLKDTPSSVFVFDKKDIDRLAAPDRLRQILQNVPNLLVPNHRDPPVIRGQQSIGVLSGIDAFFGGARPRTVLQIDGRTVTFTEFLNSPEGIWDVDHVEVFVTPQTTTQGVNSIAGAIFLHTTDPAFTPQAKIRAIAGQFHRRQLSAAASAPLIDDQLALRVSGDDYQSVATTRLSGPVVGISDLNADRYWTIRAKLLAKPNAVPGLEVLTTYAHTHTATPQLELATSPVRERRDDSYIYGYYHSNVDALTNLITYSVTSELQSRTTISLGWLRYHRFAPQGFGQNRITGSDGSFESVLEWKPNGPISAIGGLGYQRYDFDQFIDLSVTPLGTGTFRDKQPSAGIFGELTWHATDRLLVTAGGRYQVDTKRRTGVLTISPPLLLDYDATSRAFLPKLSIAYDVTDDVRAGLLVQRAYNPGGVDLVPERQGQIAFKPEYMWDYELFTRSRLFGDHLAVNSNIFYEALKDQQRTLDYDLKTGFPFFLIVNEPKAAVYGAELSVAAKPVAALSFNLALGYLKTRILEGVAINDPYVHKGFYGAPPWTISGGAEWEPVRKVHLSTQVRHVARYAGDDFGTPIAYTRGFWMIDGRATWETRHFTAFLYAQNMLNAFRVLGFAGPYSTPDLQAELTDPREIGVGVEAHF